MTTIAHRARIWPPVREMVAVMLVVVMWTAGTQWLAYGPLALGVGFLIGLPFGIAAVGLTLRWRWGLYLVLAYLTIEGAVANLLYPAVTPLLVKDFLLAGTYLGFFASLVWRRERWLVPPKVLWPAVALVLLTAVESLNPGIGNLAVALVGVRVLLFYIPLYALGYYLAREAGAADKLVRFVLITSLPITLFGIYQYFIGPEAVAALGEGFARSVWIVGPEATEEFIYRPASTFAWVGHFGSYLLFIALAAFAALHARPRPVGLVLLSVIFAAAAAAVVLQSQRTNWVLLPVAALGTYLLNGDWRGTLRGAPLLMLGLLVALIAGRGVLANRLPTLISGITTPAYFGPLESAPTAVSASLGGRLFQFTGRLQGGLFTPEALLGQGTGTALGAARYVNEGEVPDAFESGWFIPFYMFGIGGLLVYAWLYAALLHAAWMGMRTIASPQRWVPTALFGYILLTAVLTGPVNYPPTNVYFWLFSGLLAGFARGAVSVTPRAPLPAGTSSARGRPLQPGQGSLAA